MKLWYLVLVPKQRAYLSARMLEFMDDESENRGTTTSGRTNKLRQG
ncbi:MAG: hypothetical protein AAF316_02100 [Cyanobacteria bacterium P01_A01_bin.80]